MTGAGEGGIGRRNVAEGAVDQDVVRQLVPDPRRIGPRGLDGIRHPRQHLVVDRHLLGGRLRLAERLRDHHRHRLADMTRLVVRQQKVRSDEHRGSTAAGQLDVVVGGRHRIVRDRLQTIRLNIGAGEHPQHARHRHRLGHVDRADPRVGMRRAHHRGPDLAGQSEVVREAAAPGDEPPVLVARQRLPDSLE